jgi:integrase
VAAVLAHLERHAESWEGGRLHTLAAVLAYTGVRKMEALRLRVEDVDLVRGFVFVAPNGRPLKTPGSEAPVPCPAALLRILRDWIPRCGSEWLIPMKSRKGPWTNGTNGKRPTDLLRAAGLAAGVEGFTPLSLRHSLATHLAGFWGLKERQVQMVLRHTTSRTQRRYIHPDLANLAALVRGFEYGSDRPAPRGLRRKRRLGSSFAKRRRRCA